MNYFYYLALFFGVMDSHGGGVLQLNSSYRIVGGGICGLTGSPFTRRKSFRRRIRCDGGVRDGPAALTHIRSTIKFSPSATYIRTNLQAGGRAGSLLLRGARAEASRMRTSPLKPRLYSTNNTHFSSTKIVSLLVNA